MPKSMNITKLFTEASNEIYRKSRTEAANWIIASPVAAKAIRGVRPDPLKDLKKLIEQAKKVYK